jgi:hypothetical protein
MSADVSEVLAASIIRTLSTRRPDDEGSKHGATTQKQLLLVLCFRPKFVTEFFISPLQATYALHIDIFKMQLPLICFSYAMYGIALRVK